MIEPVLEFAFEIRVDVDPPHEIGRGADEQLSYTPITGGTVEGPLLRGRVVPGGADWAVERSGTFQLDARYLLQTEDGAFVDIHNRGYFRASPEAAAAYERGEDPDEADVYFRTAPVFQTDAPAHRWLAEHQFIGLARDEDGQICIRFFVVR